MSIFVIASFYQGSQMVHQININIFLIFFFNFSCKLHRKHLQRLILEQMLQKPTTKFSLTTAPNFNSVAFIGGNCPKHVFFARVKPAVLCNVSKSFFKYYLISFKLIPFNSTQAIRRWITIIICIIFV